MPRIGALVILIGGVLLAGCGPIAKAQLVCYGPGDPQADIQRACRQAAYLALRDVPADGRVEQVAVLIWRGWCAPGTYCPLVDGPRPNDRSAWVGVRFTAQPAVVRDVEDVGRRRPSVGPFSGSQLPEHFIEEIVSTRGAWHGSIAIPSHS